MIDEETQPEEEKKKEPTFLDLIKDIPDAPNQAIVDDWKSKYGDIYFSGFSKNECYIFRAITRKEYRDMQIEAQIIANRADPKNEAELQLRIKENVTTTYSQEDELVSTCLLWPKLSSAELAVKPGGTVPTLLEQIMAQSNFTTPQQAQMLVVKI